MDYSEYLFILFVFKSCCIFAICVIFFFFKQKTVYEMRISDWSSDVCSSDLVALQRHLPDEFSGRGARRFPSSAWRLQQCSGCRQSRRLVQQRREIGRASCRERVCQYV